ncbi:NADPH-dependent 7-cyano-7-deazaguanine reductase-like, partial [Vulpes lagopus]|uniref:NADPH-dependent 7-cyano-7-deazaguanine reductase-like n=1 Tax=Vulpes lagopus TaxID=494514 RepID=UPI001BC93663
GQKLRYIDRTPPRCFFPLPPRPKREERIGVQGSQMPFFGPDLWRHSRVLAKPCAATRRWRSLHFPDSLRDPQSHRKQVVQLSLSSFNPTPPADAAEVQARLAPTWPKRYGKGTAKGQIGVKIMGPGTASTRKWCRKLDGLLLDPLDVECTQYQPPPELFARNHGESARHRTFVTHLLKSNAWSRASPKRRQVQIRYGRADRPGKGLLQYRGELPQPQRIP